MDELILKLKQEIIEVLNLEEVKVEDIDTDAPLFMEGLGLDSIDALELTVLLEKKYGLKINTADEGRVILYSVKSIAEYITKNKKA
jgi:acyl carrier protein